MLEPGQIFATRYRVDRCIAEGGMGAIFEAVHTATERRVALKLLFPHIMSVASARKKFELEAKISARVNSPYIVEVLDAGFDEGTKSPFLVMELLRGQTLAAYVRERGALGVDEALPLLEQLAAGLDAAHKYKEGAAQKPIVHRDLKPENLFLAREHDDEIVVLKILDFGIAKVLGESCNVSQEVRGTPLYMAFEQVTAAELSPQTDVWALGLIAHFALTGQSYWRSASEQSANVQSLFAEILTLPLVAPSVRLSQLGSSVVLPAAFDGWLLTCLQRDPARRFGSAGAAVEALTRALGRTPRPRTRFSSMPAPAPALAMVAPATAPETPLPPVVTPETPLPAPVTAPLPSPPLPSAAGVESAATGSLPAIASERAATSPPGRASTSRQRLVGAAAAVAVLLGSLVWVAAGGRAPSDPSASSAAPQPLPVRDGALQAYPSQLEPPSGSGELDRAAARPDDAPRAPGSVTGELAPSPASPPGPEPVSAGLNVPTEALPAENLPAPPEPRIRIALPEEIAAGGSGNLPEPTERAPAEAAPPAGPAPPVVAVAPNPASATVGTNLTPAAAPAATPRRRAYDSKDAYNTR